MPRPKKAIEVIQILRAHDPRFEIYSNRGKGSHRMIYHPDVNGRAASIPMPFHKGKDVKPGILRSIIRRFNLPADLFG